MRRQLPAGLTYYKYGSATPGAPATYYPFVYAPPGSPIGAEILPLENKIILHLQDGALGDDDWTENGVIVDPSGAALIGVPPDPLAIQCAATLETAAIGCATSRTLLIPVNLIPPTYSGGMGTPTLKVKFDGEALDYAVPPSLTFPIGVTNLVWTYTAGVETASCTQQVTVVAGVNQAPGIAPLSPPPATLATNSSTIVTLVASDAETANLATVLVNSTSGGLVTLPSSGPDVTGNYSLTITAESVPGTETITNIVTDDCGATATNIFTVQVFQPLAMQCAAALQTNTIGCATARSLAIPAELTPPTYSGGNGPATLKVKFEGEAADYTVPASLTFPVGVTNLI